MYIIRRTDRNGGYVARSGSNTSYVKDPLKAHIYPTREAAEAGICQDNEVIEAAWVRAHSI